MSANEAIFNDQTMSFGSSNDAIYEVEDFFEVDSANQHKPDLALIEYDMYSDKSQGGINFDVHGDEVAQNRCPDKISGNCRYPNMVESEVAIPLVSRDIIKSDSGFDELIGDEFLDASNSIDFKDSSITKQNAIFANIESSDLNCDSELLEDIESVHSEDAFTPNADFIKRSEEEDRKARESKLTKLQGLLHKPPTKLLAKNDEKEVMLPKESHEARLPQMFNLMEAQKVRKSDKSRKSSSISTIIHDESFDRESKNCGKGTPNSSEDSSSIRDSKIDNFDGLCTPVTKARSFDSPMKSDLDIEEDGEVSNFSAGNRRLFFSPDSIDSQMRMATAKCKRCQGMQNPKAILCNPCNLYFCTHGIGGHKSYKHPGQSQNQVAKKIIRESRKAKREALRMAKIVYKSIMGDEFVSDSKAHKRSKLNKIRDCLLNGKGTEEYTKYMRIISDIDF